MCVLVICLKLCAFWFRLLRFFRDEIYRLRARSNIWWCWKCWWSVWGILYWMRWWWECLLCLILGLWVCDWSCFFGRFRRCSLKEFFSYREFLWWWWVYMYWYCDFCVYFLWCIGIIYIFFCLGLGEMFLCICFLLSMDRRRIVGAG